MLPPIQTRRARRQGKILVLFAIVLTSLFGLLGLVIDSGLMMASQRKTQNAADSAALAAGMELMRGQSAATARTVAINWALTHYGVTLADADVRIPPTTGPHAGNSQFVEVVASRTYSTIFVQMVGPSSSQTVHARAVAGFEAVSSGEGAIVLDPTAAPGITFSGSNTRLIVKGSVVVNSRANGYNEYGSPVPAGTSPSTPYAVSTSGSLPSDPTQAFIHARSVQVVGGIDTPANFVDYDDPVNNPSPLTAGIIGVQSDPLRLLDVPVVLNSVVGDTGQNGQGRYWQNGQHTSTGPTAPDRYPDPNITTGTVTLYPGVYDNLRINGGDVTLMSGIYVISPSQTNGNPSGLVIGTSVHGPGGSTDPAIVMFYLTGTSYVSNGRANGYWDSLDGTVDPVSGTYAMPSVSGSEPNSTFAKININASSGTAIYLKGLPTTDPDDPNDKVLFFQRRRNTQRANVGGSSTNISFDGTIYAKWAQFAINGQGSYNAQFIVGSLNLTGGSTITINGTGINRGKANQVFLVE